jgi:hypothetical protein
MELIHDAFHALYLFGKSLCLFLMRVRFDLSSQIDNPAARADFHLQQIYLLLVIQRLLHRATNGIVLAIHVLIHAARWEDEKNGR